MANANNSASHILDKDNSNNDDNENDKIKTMKYRSFADIVFKDIKSINKVENNLKIMTSKSKCFLMALMQIEYYI
ncbi:10403_t:CDS:2 [Entrophospora sp. SA101]|nr:10403_t:CDS:2 [Entrophospora sp. SA101]